MRLPTTETTASMPMKTETCNFSSWQESNRLERYCRLGVLVLQLVVTIHQPGVEMELLSAKEQFILRFNVPPSKIILPERDDGERSQ
jgi:hypothetical protein